MPPALDRRKAPGYLSRKELMYRARLLLLETYMRDTHKLIDAIIETTDRELTPAAIKTLIEDLLQEFQKDIRRCKIILNNRGLR